MDANPDANLNAPDAPSSESLSDVDEVARWLQQPHGRAVIARVLEQFRLPEHFDTELELRVRNSAQTMHATGTAIQSIPAWCTATLRLRARHLLVTAEVRRSATLHRKTVIDGEPRAADERAVSDPGPSEVLAWMNIDDTHRLISKRWLDRNPWEVSAALTVLATLAVGAGVGNRCPAPAGGAGEIEAAHWAGLWYAGQRDSFPSTGKPDDATIRQRRSRNIVKVKDLLRSTSTIIEGGEPHG